MTIHTDKIFSSTVQWFDSIGVIPQSTAYSTIIQELLPRLNNHNIATNVLTLV